MKATLRWAQLWGSCIFVLFMLGLLRPAYGFDIPGVGLRVCICAPWVLCPCEDPDAGQGGSGSDRPPPMQHDGRDGTRGPVGRFQTPSFSMDWQQLAAASDQYADAKVRITHFSNYRDERQALLDVSAVLIEVADDHFATGETGLGTGNVTTIRHLLDTAVDFGSAFVPPVSMALDAVQLSMGRNLFTGEPLTKWDAGLLLVDLVAFGCSKAFTKTARALVKVAAREGDAARLAKPWLSYIAKVDEAAQLIVPASQAAGPNFTLGEQADQAIAHFVQGAKLSSR